MTNDCASGRFGTVAPTFPTGPSSQTDNADAATAPVHWATIYGRTSRVGNRRTDQKPIVTAGLMCAPERCPIDATQSVTTRPNASATPEWPNAWVLAATMAAPGPTATSANVPRPSAA